MKKRSVLYTWVIEFSILLILMATMCVTLTLSARKKVAGRIHRNYDSAAGEN